MGRENWGNKLEGTSTSGGFFLSFCLLNDQFINPGVPIHLLGYCVCPRPQPPYLTLLTDLPSKPMADWDPRPKPSPGGLVFDFAHQLPRPTPILPLLPPTVISHHPPPPHWSPPGIPRIVCSLRQYRAHRLDIRFFGLMPPRCSISPHPPPTVISTTHPHHTGLLRRTIELFAPSTDIEPTGPRYSDFGANLPLVLDLATPASYCHKHHPPPTPRSPLAHMNCAPQHRYRATGLDIRILGLIPPCWSISPSRLLLSKPPPTPHPSWSASHAPANPIAPQYRYRAHGARYLVFGVQLVRWCRVSVKPIAVEGVGWWFDSRRRG